MPRSPKASAPKPALKPLTKAALDKIRQKAAKEKAKAGKRGPAILVQTEYKKAKACCPACGRTPEEEQFVTLQDDKGNTLGAGGVVCVAALKRLFPDLAFPDACVLISTDARRKAEFDTARIAVEEEETSRADATLPLFLPFGEVRRQQSFGHEIYIKAAAYTEGELTSRLGCSPLDLGMKPFKCEFKSPGEAISYYAVSLAGLTDSERASCRKVKVYADTHAEHCNCYLNQHTQLSKDQPARVFEHQAKQVGEMRPEKLLTMDLPTFEDLEAKAEQLDEALQQALAGGPKQSEPAQTDEQKKKAASAARMLEAISMTQPEPAKRRRGPAGSSVPANQAPISTGLPDLLAVQDKEKDKERDPEITEGDAASAAASDNSKARRSSEFNKNLDLMDDEMQKVAIAHAKTKKWATSKGLINLQVSSFMSRSDHDSGHSVAAAKKILEGLYKLDPQCVAGGILDKRLKRCVAAQKLREQVDLVDCEDFEECVNILEEHWDEMPSYLKIRITAAWHTRLFSRWAVQKDGPSLVLLRAVLDSQLPSLSASAWTGRQPTFSAVLNEVMVAVENLCEAVADGSMADDNKSTQAIQAAVEECTSAVEGVAKSIMGMFESKAWVQLVKSPTKNAEFLHQLVAEYMLEVPGANRAVQALLERDTQDCIPAPAWAEMSGSLDRLGAVMRFLASALSINVPDADPPISSSDFLSFRNQRDSTVPERLLRELCNSNDEWKDVSVEIVRTASSSAKLQPELTRVLETVEQLKAETLQPTSKRLQELTASTTELREGVRSAELKKLTQEMTELLQKLASQYLAMKPEQGILEVRSADVSSLLAALDVFKDVRSVAEAQTNLRAWMTKHLQAMSLMDLKDASAKFKGEGVADLEVVRDLLNRLAKVTIAPSNKSLTAASMWLLVTTFRAVVLEVKKQGGCLSAPTLMQLFRHCNGVCSLTEKADSPLARAVEGHLAVIKQGVSLANSVHRLLQNGNNADARLRKDTGRALLRQILSMSSGFLESTKTWDNLKDTLLQTSNETVSDQDDVMLAHLEFYDIDSKVPFEPLLTSEDVLDVMARHVQVQQRALDQACQMLKPILVPVTGEKLWKKDIAPEANLQDVLLVASKTLLQMSYRGQNFKVHVEKLDQEYDAAAKLADEFGKSGMGSTQVGSILTELDTTKLAAESLLKDARMILTEQVLTLAARLPEKLIGEARQLVQEPCTQLAASINGVSDADIQPLLLATARKIQG